MVGAAVGGILFLASVILANCFVMRSEGWDVAGMFCGPGDLSQLYAYSLMNCAMDRINFWVIFSGDRTTLSL